MLRALQNVAKNAATHVGNLGHNHPKAVEGIIGAGVAATGGLVVNKLIQDQQKWNGYTRAEKLEAINAFDPGKEAAKSM